MTEQDRREFLKRLARTAVYSAPIVTSLAAPIELVGQGMSSQHMMAAAAAQPQSQPTTVGDPAPWDRPAPGERPPPSGGRTQRPRER